MVTRFDSSCLIGGGGLSAGMTVELGIVGGAFAGLGVDDGGEERETAVGGCGGTR